MESNNIVIKMYLLYTGDKCTENDSRRGHTVPRFGKRGVTATKGAFFGLTSEDGNFCQTKIRSTR